jgi:putative SOS response-associated peptidase YedK
MITRESGDDLSSLHHRTPAHFSPELACDWMTSSMEVGELCNNSVQPPLSFHEVSTDVNSVRNNRADLIEQVTNDDEIAHSDHPRLF